MSRPKIFLSALCVLSISVVLAACGDDDGGGGSSGDTPLDKALRYLPKDTPFTATLSTDLNGSQVKSAEQILEKFPFANIAKGQLQQLTEKAGTDFDEIKGQLGNPFVVGSTNAKAFINQDNNDQNFVGAIQAKDGDKLSELVKKQSEEIGEADGATLYKTKDGTIGAVDGDVLVVAGNEATLKAALERQGGDDAYTEDAYNAATAGISPDSLVRAQFNAQALLASDPDSAQALKAPWVKALRTVGLGLTIESDEVRVDYNVKTEGVSAADQPIAAGPESPNVIKRPGEIGFGIRGADQIVKFAESTAQAIAPDQYAEFTQARAQIEKKLGVSIDDDLIGQIDGQISGTVQPEGGKFGIVAPLKDPKAFKATLDKVGKDLADLLSAGGTSIGYSAPKTADGFYALGTGDGKSVTYAVIGDKFVLATDPKIAGALAQATPVAVPGATGAVVAGATLEQLVAPIASQFGGDSSALGGGLGAQFLEPLGDLISSLEASDDGLKGSFKVTFD